MRSVELSAAPLLGTAVNVHHVPNRRSPPSAFESKLKQSTFLMLCWDEQPPETERSQVIFILKGTIGFKM